MNGRSALTRPQVDRGGEDTFAQDLHTFEPMRDALEPIIAKVWRHCQATGIRGRTVTLKVKFANF